MNAMITESALAISNSLNYETYEVQTVHKVMQIQVPWSKTHIKMFQEKFLYDGQLDNSFNQYNPSNA